MGLTEYLAEGIIVMNISIGLTGLIPLILVGSFLGLPRPVKAIALVIGGVIFLLAAIQQIG